MKIRLPAALLSLALSSPLCADEPVSAPLVEIASGLPGKQVRLVWASEAGVRYRIERSTNLTASGGAGGWKQLALVEATGTEGEWLDPEPTTEKSFYRIVQPQPEVFSIPEPVLPPTGGNLILHGQRIPDGSKLVVLVDGVPQELALTAMGGGLWRAASLLGGALPGGAIVSAIAVRDPSGSDLVTLNLPITITETGRATDSPPSLPPAAPLASSNPIPGVGIVVKRNGAGSYSARSTGEIGWLANKRGASVNPLYQESGNKGENPLFEAKSELRSVGGGGTASPLYDAQGLETTSALYQGGSHRHAISQKGTGTSGRVVPASSGLPGEVSLRHVSLDVPCPAGPALSWICTYRSKVPVESGLGAGWDFSYNISIEPVPLAAGANAPRLIVRDGGGRADVFLRQPNGTYRCDGMFREGSFRHGVFTLTFANAGRWVFRPLDGSPGAGKISSIIDRNEIPLTCTYDSSGLLSRVSDAFGRSLAVEWSSSPSRIESVTCQDATGAVSYQKIEFDYLTSAARLSSVSSPFEPGSPPSAGPVSFTYSDGLADPNLNGNLLTVHDGAGRLLEGFEYSSVTDPLAVAYDTCSAHDRNRGASAAPQLRTTFAVLLTGNYESCENDEWGRVTVRTFDKLHRLTRERCYTGFGTPDTPVTTAGLPDPATKLRSTDPDFFETSCSYNADSLCTRIVHPDGSRERIIFDRDFRKDCPVRERGNARVVTLVSSGGEERTVTCDHLPGFGSPESARPGNPIGGLTIKGGKNPGGTIYPAKLIWSPRSNVVGDEECDNGSIMKLSGGGMPNRISMNVTVPKQTQGATFGEKVKSPRDSSSGLATGRRQHQPISFGNGIGDITYIGTCDALGYIGTCDASSSEYVGPCDTTHCDASFVTRTVTAHGQAFTCGYDARGNLTDKSGPVPGSGVSFGYNGRGQITSVTVQDGPDSSFHSTVTYGPNGFPSSVTSDPGGLAITTAFDHDDLGRVTSITDPLTHVWSYGYDQRGTLVSVTTPGVPSPVVTAATLDPAGMVARVDTSHLGADGQPVAENPAYSTFFVHDSRGRLVRIAAEDRPVDVPSGALVPDPLQLEKFAITDFTIDDAGQVTRVSTPAASRGQTVDLVCEFTYDERGLPHRIIEGGVAAASAVITETDYDTCGAPVRVSAVAKGIPVPQVTFTWDGFHRLSSSTDPMGNVASMSYDNQGFVTTTVLGEVEDLPGSAGNVMLYRSSSRGGGPSLRAFNQNSSRSNHTRAFNQNASRSNHTRLGLTADLFFDVVAPDDTCVEERFATSGSAEPGMETTVVHRSPAGLPMSVTCNGDSVLTMDYDSAGRLSLCSDGATTTALTLDKKGGVLVCGDTDHFRVQGTPDKTFTLTYTYDALGRCTSVTDGIGNSATCMWDSLGRCVSTTQPGGLMVTMAYDGDTVTGPFSQQVIADADGDGKPDVLSSSLSRAGEVVHFADSYGHRTSLVRDQLGRVTRCNYPDGTFDETTFDSVGRPTGQRQKSGVILACDFNLRGDVTSISHSQLPAGIIPVPPTAFSYNGLGDCVRCEQGSSILQWTFDSLGNPLSESQGGRTVSRTFNHRGRTGITYPDGRRFAESRDALGYLLSVTSLSAAGVPAATPEVTLQYAGSRVWRSTQANGVVTTYDYRGDGPVAPPESADFSFDACTAMTAYSTLLGHELTHVVQQRDRDQRILSRQTLFTESPQGPGRMQTFTRDALGRITGCMTRRREAGQPQPITEMVTYVLGKEGRRIQELRNGVTGDYTQDPGVPPGDQQMDQYTSWPGGDLGWDDEGNLRTIEGGGVKSEHQYDAEGRLVAVIDVSSSSSGPVLVSYGYDAVGRRISRTVPGGSGLPSVTTEFVFDGSECIQEWSDDGTGTGTVNAAVSFACAEGIKYGITTRDGTVYYPVATAAAATNYRYCTCPTGYYASGRSGGGGRTCTCPIGYFYSAARNKVEHWGDPHENLNGKHIKDWGGICPGGGRVWPKSGYWCMNTNSAGAVTERFDSDDAGKPVFLDAVGTPTGSSSSIGPVRWMAPESMWEPSIGMLLGPGAVYCPDLGMTVATGYGHVTVLKAAATGGGGGSGGSARVQDHNSSRSNKSAN
jgi:YD repeat-containing protein